MIAQCLGLSRKLRKLRSDAGNPSSLVLKLERLKRAQVASTVSSCRIGSSDIPGSTSGGKSNKTSDEDNRENNF